MSKSSSSSASGSEGKSKQVFDRHLDRPTVRQYNFNEPQPTPASEPIEEPLDPAFIVSPPTSPKETRVVIDRPRRRGPSINEYPFGAQALQASLDDGILPLPTETEADNIIPTLPEDTGAYQTVRIKSPSPRSSVKTTFPDIDGPSIDELLEELSSSEELPSVHTSDEDILSLSEDDPARFASFDSWKEALEEEWEKERLYFGKLYQLEAEKLKFYKSVIPLEQKARQLETLQEREENGEHLFFFDQDFLTRLPGELDKEFVALCKQHPDLQPTQQVFLEAEQEIATLEEKLLTAGALLTEDSGRAANRRFYTRHYIYAMESDDELELKQLERNQWQHLHPDITEKRYEPHLKITNRFASFDSWKAALKEEWAELTNSPHKPTEKKVSFASANSKQTPITSTAYYNKSKEGDMNLYATENLDKSNKWQRAEKHREQNRSRSNSLE